MNIAVYGASGYRGRLVLAEAVRHGLGVVLAGRDAVRLRRAAAAAGLSDPDIRLAGIDDHDAPTWS
ncbi:MAG: hypothetical protein IRZ07_12790 [Microbispora sp.]|nr:hypothetical protein [Microbispora sp.]